MNWLGYRQVNVTAITMNQADLRRRVKLPHVVELAASVQAKGGEPIHAPTIRLSKKPDGGTRRVLLCGRDRMAAELINKRKRIWVHVAECDDLEAEELEILENLHKRPEDKPALVAALAKVREAYHRAQDPDAAEQTIAAKVNADIAKATGDTVRNVKRLKAGHDVP